MILIQVVLVAGFVMVLLRFLSNPNSAQIKAWKKILGVLFTVVAVFAVLFPESLNVVAHKLGVGRGADLLLYLLTLAFIASQISNYSKTKEEKLEFTRLARKLTIIDANNRYQKTEVGNDSKSQATRN